MGFGVKRLYPSYNFGMRLGPPEATVLILRHFVSAPKIPLSQNVNVGWVERSDTHRLFCHCWKMSTRPWVSAQTPLPRPAVLRCFPLFFYLQARATARHLAGIRAGVLAMLH